MRNMFRRRWRAFVVEVRAFKSGPLEMVLIVLALINGIVWLWPGDSFINSLVLRRLGEFGSETRWAWRSIAVGGFALLSLFINWPPLRITSTLTMTGYFGLLGLVYGSGSLISVGTWYNIFCVVLSIGCALRVFFDYSTRLRLLNRRYRMPVRWQGWKEEVDAAGYGPESAPD